MKSYWQFEIEREPLENGSEVYVLMQDGEDEPDLEFVYDFFIPKTQGGKFELSGFCRCDGPGYVRHGDQKPTISHKGTEVFFLETRKTKRAVSEPKFHDPEFKVESKSP